jgi:hypothetical protein
MIGRELRQDGFCNDDQLPTITKDYLSNPLRFSSGSKRASRPAKLR